MKKKNNHWSRRTGDELARRAAFIEQLCEFEKRSIELKKVNLDLTFCQIVKLPSSFYHITSNTQTMKTHDLLKNVYCEVQQRKGGINATG